MIIPTLGAAPASTSFMPSIASGATAVRSAGIEGPTNVTCARFTPDENYIVSTASDSVVKVWDVRQQTLMRSYEHDCMQCSQKTKVGISPNSQYVVVGTREGHMVYLNL